MVNKAENRWAVVFDFDGTMTPKTQPVMEMIDTHSTRLSSASAATLKEIRARYLPHALAGRLTPEQEYGWLAETIDLYIAAGMTLADAWTVLSRIRIRPGVAECLRVLDDAGVPCAIVSYSVAQFIGMILARHGMHHLVERVYSANVAYAADTGRIIGYDAASFVMPCNKGEWSRRFADKVGVPYDRLLAVGDSGGDKTLGHLQEHRFGIAKDSAQAEALREFMDDVAVTETFDPVTAWLRSKIEGGSDG